MFILSRDTLLNPGVLETRSLPKKIFGRVQIFPRGASVRTWLRLTLEIQLLRYLLALLPFIAMIAFSRNMALGVTQAPLAMILVIGIIELKVLRLSDRARERLMSEDEAARIVDAFSFHAKSILREVAARRGVTAGELLLFVEQSELARLSPLTLVSIQSADPSPHVMSLNSEDRTLVSELFNAEVSERDLHRANLRLDTMLREVRIEASGVSAHARLAAWIDTQATKV